MNPFDLPPAGDPVSFDAPGPAAAPDRPRRGRTALVVLLTLGLVGGGVAGVSQFASADRPDLAVTTQDEPTDETIAPADDESSDDSAEQPKEEPAADDDQGRIVLDTGDGEPIVIDLGDLDVGPIGDLAECIGLPSFGGELGGLGPDDPSSGEFLFDLEELLGDVPIDLDALEDLEGHWPPVIGEGGPFGVDGGSVTVVGPDGVSVVDLGENGSVTVTSDDGELAVSTDGDATVTDLDDLLGEFGSIFERRPPPAELPRSEPVDPNAVQECIDETLGN